MDAMFFVLRTGCQWNALHATGLCSSSSAHRRVQAWTAAGVFLAWWTDGLVGYEALSGIHWEGLAMDGAMTKAPLGGGETVGQKPTDRGKLGSKRSVLTDGGDLPLGLAVEGAKRNDFKMVEAMLTSIPIERPTPTPAPPQGICWDTGEDDDEVRELRVEVGVTAHIRARGEEAKARKPEAGCQARRWVVERTHSGMHRFRRVLSRCDKKVCAYLALLHMACAYMTYRQADLVG
jgi:transposase